VALHSPGSPRSENIQLTEHFDCSAHGLAHGPEKALLAGAKLFPYPLTWPLRSTAATRTLPRCAFPWTHVLSPPPYSPLRWMVARVSA
jgi:hypothetical protein